MRAAAPPGTLCGVEPNASPYELADAYLLHIEDGGAATPEDFLAERGVDSPDALELLRVVAGVESTSGRLPRVGERIEHYRVEARIGKGGMGVVFRAHDERLDRRVALKVCRRAMLGDAGCQRFRREARALARLRHPHIVEVYDIGETDHLLYYAMELVDGPSLDVLLDAGPLDFPAAEVARRFAELARALHLAHQEGLVHRDVKPGNILVASDTRFVLTDFGVVHWEELARLTGTHDLPGTPAYMAPERFHLEPAAPAQDQFALGAVLFQALTGHWPARESSLAELYRARGGLPLPPIEKHRPDVTPALTQAVLRAVRGRPEERHASLEAFAEALTVPVDARTRSHDLVGCQLGPYQLDAWLGAGGMGTVYRATEVDTGVTVAVKVLHPELSRGGTLFTDMAREVEAGRRVIHPHVVHVRSAHVERLRGEAHALVVMEYVEGRTLRAELEASGPLHEGLLREVARQAAQGLAAVHAAGLLHGDVKPENLILDAGGALRLMDLGVTAPVGTTETRRATSLAYAAPERFREEVELGPPSDLYALGATLFELATGRPPFEARGAAPLIRAHLEDPAPVPERATDALSPFLAELIQALLAKQPAARFAHADDLCEVLEQCEGSRWWRERRARDPLATERAPRVDVARETDLIGHAAAIAAIRAGLADLEQGTGGIVHLAGESGIGKTRLLAESADVLSGRSLRCLYGAFRPGGGTDGLTEALVGFFGPGRVESHVARYVGESPELNRLLSNLVVNGVAADPTGRFQPESLAMALRRFAEGVAGERPTVWMIDDLHLASRDARSAVGGLLAATRTAPLLVIAAGESELGALVPALPAGAGTTEHPLSRLAFEESQQLLSARVGPVGISIAPRLHRASGGNPGLLLEIVEDLFVRGLLARGDTGGVRLVGDVSDVTVPESAAAVVRQRIESLGADEREVLEVGAVQGHRFEPDLVAAVLAVPRLRVLQRLAAIERRSGLVRNAPREAHFDSALARDTIYDALTEDLRRECHSLLADAHEARVVDAGTGEDALFLAEHRLAGANPALGLPHVQQSLRHLRERHEVARAAALARGACAAAGGPATAEGLPFLVHEIDALQAAGEHPLAETRLTEGAAVLGEHHRAVDRAALMRQRGATHRFAGRMDDALEDLGTALALAELSDDRREVGRIHSLLGAVTLGLGEMATAEQHFQRALAIGREHDDAMVRWISWNNLGNVSRHEGRVREALERYEKALDVAREARPGFVPAMLPLTRARALLHMGHREEARRLAEEGLRRASEADDMRLTTSALEILAGVHVHAGETTKALEAYAEIHRQNIAANQPLIAAYNLLSMADCHAERGEVAEQLRCLTRAADIAQDLDVPPLIAITRCLLAAAGEGDLGEAEAVVIAMLPNLGLAERVRLYWSLHQASGDRAHLEAAVDCTRQLLEGIGAPEADHVAATHPVLRRILERAAEFGMS